ncbi:mycothiol transferase [Jiangella anatolica]|nr:DUF664 domain-containing protein [Jiangella anatolica]
MPIHHDDRGYLRESRRQVLRALDGLDEYQIRRPMTPTGTNLLGVVKHLVGIEAGYLGTCLGHPFPEPLPWIGDEQAAVPNRDMWATATESRDHITGLYRRSCEHSDRVLDEIGLNAAAAVPWWPAASRATTAEALLARVLTDTAMHAGQLQVLRELIDGRAGSDRDSTGDDRWWAEYRSMLDDVARRFQP